MTKLLLLFLLIMDISLSGMQSIQKWLTQDAQLDQLQCPEFRVFQSQTVLREPFLFQNFPLDMQMKILTKLVDSENFETAVDAIRSFSQTSKFYNVLKDSAMYSQIIDYIARKHRISPALVQLYVGSKIEVLLFEKFVANKNNELFKIYQDAKYFDSFLDIPRSRNVFKLVKNKLPLNVPNNWNNNCVPLWVYQDNSFLCRISSNWPTVTSTIARVNSDRNLDTMFGGTSLTNSQGVQSVPPNGIIRLVDSFFLDSGVQNDGKLIAAIFSFNEEFILMRFNVDGAFDTTFGHNGRIVADMGTYSMEDIFGHIKGSKRLKAFADYIFINPTNGTIVFKVNNIVKKFSPVDGHELE